MNGLCLGANKRDITPRYPVPLAGFASREGRCFERVDSRLYLRTLVFAQPAPGGGTEKAALLSADLLFWSDEEAGKLRERIAGQCGIPYERILLHATHNHSGAAVSERTVGIGDPDAKYLAEMSQAAVDSVEEAWLGLEQVTVHKGIGKCAIGVNRRKREGDGIVLGPNPEGERDPDLTVVAFNKTDGETKAMLVHYACHPVISGENAVSSEFCGFAMETLEREIGSGAICAFLQGCCGDINPYGGLDPNIEGPAAVEGLGRILARDALGVMDKGLRRMGFAPIASSTFRERLPYDRFEETEDWRGIADDDTEPEHRREWARRFAEQPERLRSHAAFEAIRLTIADGLTFVAMNGEMVVKYGLFVKKFGKEYLPLAYSNGMVGYVTTAEQLREGGYEPHGSVPYFGMPAPFRESAERLVLHGLEKLLRSE